MLVINEAFIRIHFKFQKMVDELLGMPGRDMQMDPHTFPPNMIQILFVFDVPQIQETLFDKKNLSKFAVFDMR
jgi:hypothetical protein